MASPSYHDLHITTAELPRTSIFNLPFGLMITCTRTAGWELWQNGEVLLASEMGDKWLRLDADGHVIVDSMQAEGATEQPQPKCSACNDNLCYGSGIYEGRKCDGIPF